MYLIANITTVVDHGYDQVLPDERRPKYIHSFRDDAETELLRLKKAYPEDEFVLFSATERAIATLEVPTVYRTEPIPVE